jgi:ketosteroid isomerase-like protein
MMIDSDHSTDLEQLVDGHFRAEVTGDMDGLLATFTDDVEHDVLGSPDVSHGKQQVRGCYEALHFRLLHVFEIRDGQIARENAWLDAGAIQAQLA